MSIWVRSQNIEDEEGLLELNGFNKYLNDGVYEVIGFDTANSNSDIYYLLGSYSTKEKASKVLGMLQDAITGKMLHKNRVDVALGKNDTTRYHDVFIMPQDNEV